MTIPLPEPTGYLCDWGNDHKPVYTADKMHAHAAAVTADLHAEIERLRIDNKCLVKSVKVQRDELRAETAALRAAAEQALEALQWENKWNEVQKTRHNISTNEAITALSIALKGTV
jgi:hypothetical protein